MAPVCVDDDDIRGNMMTSNIDGYLLKFEMERKAEKERSNDEED